MGADEGVLGGRRQAGEEGCCFLPLVWGRLRELRFCAGAAARPVSAPSLLTTKKRSRVPPQLARRPRREGGRGGAAVPPSGAGPGGPRSPGLRGGRLRGGTRLAVRSLWGGGGGRLGVEPGAAGRNGNGGRRGPRAEAPGSGCAGVAQVQTRDRRGHGGLLLRPPRAHLPPRFPAGEWPLLPGSRGPSARGAGRAGAPAGDGRSRGLLGPKFAAALEG